MKKVILFILVVVIFASVNLTADEFTRGLGFTAGKISGVGFAYRQYFDNNGIQFTFGMLADRDNVPKFPSSPSQYELDDNDSITKTGWQVDGWFSFMYMRTLRKSELTRFYCFVGASLNIDYSKKYTQLYESNDITGSPTKVGHNDNKYYFGPGIGLDYQLSKYISLIVELPVSISSDNKIDTYIPQGGVIIRF